MAQGTRGAGAPSESSGGASSRTTGRTATARGAKASSRARTAEEIESPPRGRARAGSRTRSAAAATTAASTSAGSHDEFDGAGRSVDEPSASGTALEGPVEGPRVLSGRLSGRLAELPRLAADRMRAARAARAERAVDAGGGADWGRVGAFGLGLTVGALVGAGAALLLAPATGFETRTRLVRRARGASGQIADRWDELADDVERRARTSRRQIRRALTEARWRAEDALETRRARALRRPAER